VEQPGTEETGIQQASRYCGAEPVRQFLTREQMSFGHKIIILD